MPPVRIRRAFSGVAAAGGIDCIVVDVKMPGLSGIELQSELNRRGSHPPMIFVTSYEDERTRMLPLAAALWPFFATGQFGNLIGS